MDSGHPGREALIQIERILEQKPHKDDDALSMLTRCLAEFREELIGRIGRRPPSPEDRACLMHLNAIISVVMGMHFPLGQVPWAEFGKAASWLSALVERVEGAAAA